MNSKPSPKISSIRGMNDLLPEQLVLWHFLEAAWRELTRSYCYQEIRMPILEPTELFNRSVGAGTDIVNKEMYSFIDRNGDSLSLRPEGTASCVRAVIQHNLSYNAPCKLWYGGPMYRYERPQAGRYRQFHQLSLEAIGFNNIDIEIEMLIFSWRFWNRLGLQDCLTLELNNLGDASTRKNYTNILVKYFEKNYDLLDADSKKRLKINPLRILDSKNPALTTIITNAPKLIDYLTDPEQQKLQYLTKILAELNINYKINPNLVRGLDYYTGIVFEWVTDLLGAQNAVAAGGRYDNLIVNLGGRPTSANGFSVGVERIILLLQQVPNILAIDKYQQTPDIYVITNSRLAKEYAFNLCEQFRDKYPEIKLYLHIGAESVKSQFKKADKSGAKLALVIGEDEVKTNSVIIKFLREHKEQVKLSNSDFINNFNNL